MMNLGVKVDLIATLRQVACREARMQDVVPNLRCSGCKATRYGRIDLEGQVTFQIVFVGGSGEALLGGKATKDPKPTEMLSG